MMSGMNYSPGDLVGIPFPYSDLKTEKRRPVLVITHQDHHGDFICAAVTSVPTPEFAVIIHNSSMRAGSLPRKSWIRCDKLFTLSGSIAVKHYGSLNNTAFNMVRENICGYLGCK
jgi:mRNA interferase MazF